MAFCPPPPLTSPRNTTYSYRLIDFVFGPFVSDNCLIWFTCKFFCFKFVIWFILGHGPMVLFIKIHYGFSVVGFSWQNTYLCQIIQVLDQS